MNYLNIASLAIAVLLSSVGAITSILNFRIRRQAEVAKVHIDSSTAAQIDETREREREKHWQEKLDRTEKRWNDRVEALQREVNILEAYVDRVVPWTWGTVRELRLNGIDYQDPPSLADVRREFSEGKKNGAN